MPAIALALGTMAVFSRLIRSDMIATLKEDFILSARSKGLSDRYILFRHALRPSSLSLMTIVGISFGALLGGTVVIEQLFAIPGPGRLAHQRHQRARHHPDPGHHGVHRRDVHHHQHRGRPALRRARPANPEELIVATTESSIDERRWTPRSSRRPRLPGRRRRRVRRAARRQAAAQVRVRRVQGDADPGEAGRDLALPGLLRRDLRPARRPGLQRLAAARRPEPAAEQLQSRDRRVRHRRAARGAVVGASARHRRPRPRHVLPGGARRRGSA